MTFKHNAVPSIAWRKTRMCNALERHLMGIMLSGESQPPKVTRLMTHLHNRVTEFRTGEQIREPELEVKKGVASCNTAK